MAVGENDFPRGGTVKSSAINKVSNKKTQLTLFGKYEDKSNKKRQLKKQKAKTDDVINKNEESDNKTVYRSVEALSYKSIREGMIILGCIHKVNEMAVQVSLPGLLYAHVLVTNISKPYTSYLQNLFNDQTISKSHFKSLQDMFKPGQYVCAKVLNLDQGNNHLYVSLDPCDIHYGLKHNEIVEGSIHMVAVQSIEDHGYVIDIGVPNCRAFLPNKEVSTHYGKLGIGELLWCSVSKIVATLAATTVTLRALDEEKNQNALNVDTSLNNILPGMKIDATIEKIIPNGLQVKFLQKYYGFISAQHLQNADCDTSIYSRGEVIKTSILLIDDTTKLTHLTMRNLQPVEIPSKIKIGDIVKGKVISRSSKGVYLKLHKTFRGFITFKRIMTNETLEYSEIYTKFGIGTTHYARVMSFDYMENTFICSNEKKTLKENCFSLSDLAVGQIVTAVIQDISIKRLLVKVGNLTGIITSLHISDFPIQKLSITSRFKKLQSVKCRVLHMIPKEQKLYLTMKPSLMQKEISILSSLDEIAMNKIYKGVVVQILSSGLLVAFFNDLKGFVPKSQIGIENDADTSKTHFIGETVDCSVLNLNKTKMRLTLSFKASKVKDKAREKQVLKLGSKVSGIVKEKNKDGLKIIVDDKECLLPKALLSQSKTLHDEMMNLFQIDEKIDNLLCINTGKGMPVLSFCAGEHNSSNFHLNVDHEYCTIYDFKEIKKFSIIKGWIRTVSKDQLNLICALRNFNGVAQVHKSNMLDNPVDDLRTLNILPFQPFDLKILEINRKKKILMCSTKLCDVVNANMQTGVSILLDYLFLTKTILNKKMEEGVPIASLSIGNRVHGKIIGHAENKTELVLPNNIKAIAHKKSDLQVGQRVWCVILWIDYKNNQVEIVFDDKIVDKLDNSQDNTKLEEIEKKSGLSCRTLLVRKDVVIGALVSSKQIVFLPTFRHINDLFPPFETYSEKHSYEVDIVGRSFGHLVCTRSQIENFKKSVSDQQLESTTNEKKAQTDELLNDSHLKKLKRSYQNISSGSESSAIKRIKQSVEEKSDTSISHALEYTNEDLNVEHKSKNEAQDSTLGLLAANNFFEISCNETDQNKYESSDDESLNETDNTRKGHTASAKSVQNDENDIRKNALKLLDSYDNPQTADQFDRLVIANPNNSLSWIKYMAYHLQATEIEKARAVAYKAISTISFREEQEKLNVWISLLNLENRYGTKESFNNVLLEALQKNDAYEVYMQAINILSESSKLEEFNDLANKVLKKYSVKLDCWLNIGQAFFKAKLVDKARQTMIKGLDILPTNKHVQLLTHFASLENQFGNHERAQALFERLVTSYPQRTDIWSQYVDMLVKCSQIDTARNILRSAVSQVMPAKKIKILFKKFLSFESKYGDEKAVAEVRLMAENYAKNISN